MNCFIRVQHVDSSLDWRGAHLIMPSVCVGNVGQLAVDVLITTPDLGFVLIGYLDDENVVAVAGNQSDDVTRCDLGVALEVYYSPSLHAIVVQQRAPVIKGLERLFAENLLKWAMGWEVSGVCILSSKHAHWRGDSELARANIHFLASPMNGKLSQVAETLGWALMKRDSKEPILDQFGELSISLKSENNELIVSSSVLDSVGCGITPLLFNLAKMKHIQTIALIVYAAEGANAQEGLFLAMGIDSFFDTINYDVETDASSRKRQWTVPAAWQHVFGAVQNSTIIYD